VVAWVVLGLVLLVAAALVAAMVFAHVVGRTTAEPPAAGDC
jgi:hypothetical protein